jgi:hypothetical protein
LAHRRAGSDITLRDSAARQALQALVASCDRVTDSLSASSRSKDAKDIVDCGRSSTDTVAVNDPERYGTRPVLSSECPPEPAPRDTIAIAPAPDAPGAVVGIVTDARSGEPVAGAEVVILALRKRIVVDAAGAFRLDSLSSGTYDLVVRRFGYNQRKIDGVHVSAAAGIRLRAPLASAVLDGCPGFMVRPVRKP